MKIFLAFTTTLTFLILTSCYSTDSATAASKKKSANSISMAKEEKRTPTSSDNSEAELLPPDATVDESLGSEAVNLEEDAFSETELRNLNTHKCLHDPKTFRCVKFEKNYDGDTITFSIPNIHPLLGKKISVRIYGIDTPEIKTKNSCEKAAGRMAKNLVSNLLKNAKNIEIKNVQRDKYFRILGDVYFDGNNLKDVILKNHLAYEYFGDTKKKVNWCDVMKKNNLTP